MSGPSGDQTVWAVLAHLSIFALGLVGPLALYLVYRDTSPMVRHHAAQALNFHLTLALAFVVSFVLAFVLIGLPMLVFLVFYGPVLGILAAIKASRGEPYRYPLTIPFVR